MQGAVDSGRDFRGYDMIGGIMVDDMAQSKVLMQDSLFSEFLLSGKLDVVIRL